MKLTIIIPCYNEEEVLPWTLDKLAVLVKRLKKEAATEARLLLVDDGSKDRTWELITEAAKAHTYIGGIKLSHNEGHQNALWAGMQESVATSDAVVSIDADLQDDETAIIDMARQVNEGMDIVYGVRKKRTTDTWFKRFTAQTFYKLMKSMDSEIVYNHADFRMMTHRAVEALLQYPERNLFLRGIVRQLGFREGYVYYDRRARTAGESKYPLKKMLAFSVDGITSFSTAPFEVHHLHRPCHDVHLLRDDCLCHRTLCRRRDNPRLGFTARLSLVHRRHHHHGARCNRHVYRKDLH